MGERGSARRTPPYGGCPPLPCCFWVTTTSNEVVLVLPAASLAVQVTVVVPTANRVLGAGRQVTGTGPSWVSIVEGSSYLTFTLLAWCAVTLTVDFPAMPGASTSAGRAGSRVGSTMP